LEQPEQSEVGVTQDQLKRNGVDLFRGTGKFMDATTSRSKTVTASPNLKAKYPKRSSSWVAA
jgi:hypothetical protein